MQKSPEPTFTLRDLLSPKDTAALDAAFSPVLASHNTGNPWREFFEVRRELIAQLDKDYSIYGATPPIRLGDGKAPLMLADANIAPGTINYLRQAGIYVSDVRGLLPDGHTDAQVFSLAKKSRLVLLTHDSDFMKRD